MSTTAAELLDSYLPAFCEGCGETLPQPGEPCAVVGCGTVPAITRTEALARLEQPGAVAMLEAARLRSQARKTQDLVSSQLAEADRIEHLDRLTQARDEAEAKLPPVRARVAGLARDLKRAQRAETEAAARVEDARANFANMANQEEAARRCGASAAGRTEALAKVQAAAGVLEGDQAGLQTAALARQQAEHALMGARGRVAALEGELAAAQHLVDNPGRVPRSLITLVMDLVHQVMAGDLNEGEQAAVRSLGEVLARWTGASEDIGAKAAEAARQAAADARRREARFLQPLGNGAAGVMRIPAAASTRP